MGFAGQVFAARVAIGLAFPSQSAMSEASQVVGSGAAKLYKKLNSQAVRAASQKRKLAEQEMANIEKKAKKHQEGLSKGLTQAKGKFTASMSKMNIGAKVTAGRTQKQFVASQKAMGTAKTDKQLANTFKAGDEAFMKFARHIKARAPDLMIKLFDTDQMSEVQSGKFSFAKMNENLFKHGPAGDRYRKEVTKTAELEMKNAARRKRNGMEEIDLTRKLMQEKKDDGLLTKEEHREIKKQLDAEEQGFKDVYNSAKDFYDYASEGVKEYNLAMQEHEAQAKKYEMEVAQAHKVVKAAIAGEDQAMKELERRMKNAAKAAARFAESLKNNFQNALRESISALTAMFYKLQQNTQELIEFERELMNANSVFNLTKKELFETSEVITQFGQTFGLEMQNGAEGLYQLASAGLSADEAAKVLPETLKLSMAVQGDHNTIAKLTTQTLMGFSMEMDQAAEITDKFAHVIQKSLIEYEDLTSAVKFAMPFFTATGQSVDQLLGAWTVLTNRALEAGIAGRGLRQALAEFAEHADNNEAAFARMGLEIKKADGSMKDLTVIAKEYSDIIGPDAASNTELLTSLIDDLNVRGATAFVHLVQNADEFAQAVENVENAGGELDEMVRIQNESMSSQIQILKNNIQMIFFYNDGVDRANGAMNEFHSAIIDGITAFQDLIVEGEEGNKQLTAFGQTIQEVAVEAVKALMVLLQDGVKFLAKFSGEGKTALGILKAYLIPIQVLGKTLEILGPRMTSLIIQFRVLNTMFSITTGLRHLGELITWYIGRTTASTMAIEAETAALGRNSAAKIGNAGATGTAGAAAGGQVAAKGAGMLGGIGTGISAAFGMGEVGKAMKGDKKAGKKKLSFKQIKAGFGGKKAMEAAKSMGRLANALMRVGQFFMSAAGAAVMLAAAVFALLAYGVQLMDSFGPLVDIFKGWGEAVVNLTKWVGEGLYWGFKRLVMGIGQVVHSLGFFGFAMGEVQLTTANALKEVGYMFKYWLMWLSMRWAGTFGFMIWGLDQAFKSIYNLVMDYIGNSKITEAIIGGFSALWEALFNPETGWLRWLTLTWWLERFDDLKNWWNGGQGLVDAFNTTVDIGAAIFSSVTSFIDELPAKLIAMKESIAGAVDLAAIFGIHAFKVAWNALATMMSNVALEIDIEGFGIALPDWAGGHGFEWAGYKETIGLGTWPTFEIEDALAAGGYVRAMQSGGFLGQNAKPYLVGEQGPELFVPSSSGQVINNSRTESILRNQLSSGRLGAGTGSGGTMVVDTLFARESKMGKSKIAVDTFAGVV